MFRPYNTVTAAVNAVPSGGVVSIVTGSYDETITINKAMTITAPVGAVTIGASASPKILAQDPNEDVLFDKSFPNDYSLSQNYPNPFNPETTILYSLPKTTLVNLTIYNLVVQEVKTLVDKIQPAGSKSVVWDGKNNHGEYLPSGIYVFRILTEDFIQSFKIALVK